MSQISVSAGILPKIMQKHFPVIALVSLYSFAHCSGFSIFDLAQLSVGWEILESVKVTQGNSGAQKRNLSLSFLGSF